MVNQQVRTAIVSAWLIVSAIGLCLLTISCVLSESTILALSDVMRLDHHGDIPCAFCGMTKAFMAISHGDWSLALHFNRWSIALLQAVVCNEFLATAFVVTRICNLRSPRFRVETTRQ